MANNLGGNTAERVAKVIAAKFESSRVLSKTVDTQSIAGSKGITNETGDTVYLKRPPQYTCIETPDGDITGLTKNSIGVGRVAATVQDYVTVPISYTNLEEVTQLNQLQELLDPAAEAVVTCLELQIAEMMANNAGLTYGTPGNQVDAWTDVAGMNALANGVGVPNSGDRFYVMDSFSQMHLSSAQNGLHAADSLVRTAWENAQVSANFGGVRALVSNALNTYQAGAAADRIGTLAANPDVTWATHKDTMIQSLSLTGLSVSTANAVRAGDVIQYDDIYYVNIMTRKPVLGADGLPVKYKQSVVTGGATDAAGAVTVTATNAAIFGATGLDAQFTTVSSAPVSGSAITILGAANASYKPNLFYHKSSFVLATLPLPKLCATDTIMKSKDGLNMRITCYSDGEANSQKWRIDMLPVMGIVNPLFIGKSFGV